MTLLFVSLKRRRLEARNFAVILDSLYNKEKGLLYRISGSESYKWLFGPEKFSGRSRNGPLRTNKIDSHNYRVETSPESTGNQIKAKGVLSEMAGRRSQFANGTSWVMRAVSGRTNHVREGRLVW